MKTQTSQINDLRGFSEVEEIYPMHVKYFPKSIQTRKLETLPLNWTSEMPDKGQARETEWGWREKAAEKAGSGQERTSPTLSLKPISNQIYIQKRGMSF